MAEPKPVDLDAILAVAVAQQASDLILKPGSVPGLRVNGRVKTLGNSPLSSAARLSMAALNVLSLNSWNPVFSPSTLSMG